MLKTNKVTVIIYSLTCCEASGLAAVGESFPQLSQMAGIIQACPAGTAGMYADAAVYAFLVTLLLLSFWFPLSW